MPANPLTRDLLPRLARFVPAPLKRSPAAAALGNASLLGVGYLVLGRRRLAAATAVGSALLVIVLAAAGPPAWPWRIALLLWWIAGIAHAWLLARGAIGGAGPAPLGRRRRAVAAVAGVAVMALTMLIAIDARRIGAEAAAAQESGECVDARDAIDGFGTFHKIIDGLLAVGLDEESEACGHLINAIDTAESDPFEASQYLAAYIEHPGGRWEGASDLRSDLMLEAAAASFEEAVTGGRPSVEAAFHLLTEVVETSPDRADRAHEVVDDFLASFPHDADPCRVMATTDWLGEAPDVAAAFEAATAAVPEIAPGAILGCGDAHLEESAWGLARDAYEQLLVEYPDHELTGQAQDGAELADVRGRLDGWPETDLEKDLPAYCDDPVPYSKAPAYSGSGPHAMAVFGTRVWHHYMPASWLAEDITDAALVVCFGEDDFGTELATCHYEGGFTVPHHAQRLELDVYSVRTGREVYSGFIEVGGECQSHTYLTDGAAPEKVRVHVDDEDVREAFDNLVNT